MLYLLGLNHRSASVEVRERVHFPPEELREKALAAERHCPARVIRIVEED